MRGGVDEQNSILKVWREALEIIRRYPLVTLLPAVPLAALAEVPAYLIEDRVFLDRILTYLTAALAYYLYLAYAEGLTTDYERGGDIIASRSVVGELLEAVPFVPRVLGAALIAIPLASAASVLLLVPGVWLFTRWSLSTPVICKENLGILASLKRSNALVRGRFWPILGTATVAFVMEEVIVHGGALVTGSITGSETWGEWVGGSIVAALAIPVAALTTSLAYSRLSPLAKPARVA